jgi:hypothetical protein
MKLPFPTGQTEQPQAVKRQIVPVSIQPPDMANVKSINSVAGPNARGMNLRDHAELDGLKILVVGARLAEGEQSTYVVMRCYVFAGDKPNADNAAVVVTGSENIVERLALVIEANAFPVLGKLRKGGRAWFID